MGDSEIVAMWEIMAVGRRYDILNERTGLLMQTEIYTSHMMCSPTSTPEMY